MTAMTSEVRQRFDAELAAAQAAATDGRIDEAWSALEAAHILSQPWAWPHVRVHAQMLALGWRTRDRAEVRGQLLRLVVAGPGSLSGKYPVGNTGRANVSATEPMPIPDDLAGLLEGAGRG
jgi:hypothetical protein